jgi:hypothetical protein
MTARSRRTLLVSASVLVVVIAAVAAIVTFGASPRSSPVVQVSASAGNRAAATTTPGSSTAPAPTATVPSPAPSTASSRTPATAGPSVVPVTKLARVDVVTTFAGWNGLSHAVEVGGYAAVVEPVGTCTLRLSHGNKAVTRKHTASADATTVACGGFSIPRSELSAGDWTAVLAYRSPTSVGESAAVSLTVP